MIRFIRNAIILLAAAGLVAGYAFHAQRQAGSKAPTGPAADHGSGETRGHGGGIEISDAKLAAAGIELLTAGPAVVRESIRLNGVIQPNQEALVQVTPRFPGVLRDIRKRTGDRVAKGDLLATVESNQSLTTYELRAPISGTIIDRQASLGEYASEQKPVFVIADLTTVWVDLSVYRRDIKRVRIGDAVLIDPEDGAPPIRTTISYVSPVGNSDTQSALARATVSNQDLRLRPGLFATGRLILKEKPVPIAVKLSALQAVEGRTVVFVRAEQKFEPRDVELGDRDHEQVEVMFGLVEGDLYAAKNSFVLKAELAKGEATHDH